MPTLIRIRDAQNNFTSGKCSEHDELFPSRKIGSDFIIQKDVDDQYQQHLKDVPHPV